MSREIETWYKASEARWYHRCSCWRHLKQGDGYAFDNGWYPADVPFPHAEWCKA